MAQTNGQKPKQVFFKEGQRWIFTDKSPNCVRFNEIIRNIDATKITEFSLDRVLRDYQGVNDFGRNGVPKDGYKTEWSLYEVFDKNSNAPERGVDKTICTSIIPGGIRRSYVVVPRMSTDPNDSHPCEWTPEKDAKFEDINDPRVLAIARGYKGAIADLGKYITNKVEKTIRDDYKVLTDSADGKFFKFGAAPQLDCTLKLALQAFVPNEDITSVKTKDVKPSDFFNLDHGELTGNPYALGNNFSEEISSKGEVENATVVDNPSPVADNIATKITPKQNFGELDSALIINIPVQTAQTNSDMGPTLA